MDPEYCEAPLFRLFTQESLTKIERKIQEDKSRQEREQNEDGERETEKPRPNAALEAGKQLPAYYGEHFPPDLYGKPIEDIDEFYHNKYSFMVVGKDKTIFRFSSTKALFILSPFNPLRKSTIFVLTHPFFGLCVMIVILVNCVFMAIKEEIPYTEEIFTAIYTVEGLIKIVSRGFILKPFTYLRDAWNWLDFVVVALAYITMAIELGNLAALRTFRVLRALKTVAVVPGLKTIVGALMEAVRRLRDVMILTVFVLSIFALVGLQIYMGALRYKCVKDPEPHLNLTEEEQHMWNGNESHWIRISTINHKTCGVGGCPSNYSCVSIGENPDYGYTSFDNFGWALLCAFRLMTQDYWENLYQLIIRAQGPWHMIFFVIVMLLGSFYLLNLILAIVAMSYDEQQKQDKEDEEEILEGPGEQMMRPQEEMYTGQLKPSPSSIFSEPVPIDKEVTSLYEVPDRRISIVNSKGVNETLSLPPSPMIRHNSRASMYSWSNVSKKKPVHNRASGEPDTMPLCSVAIDGNDIPYIDASHPVTPEDQQLSAWSNTHGYVSGRTRRLSSASHTSRMSMLELRFGKGIRRKSAASQQSQNSFMQRAYSSMRQPVRHTNEPTHFPRWNTSKKKNTREIPRTARIGSTKSDDNESSSSGSDGEIAKAKYFPDNPFITPSVTTFDPKDVMVLQDLVDNAMGKKKRSFEGMSKKEYMKAKFEKILNDFECCPCWQTFSHYVELFILDAFVDLFITLCILVNTVFMAMDMADMSEQTALTLQIGNYVFTIIFTLEAVLKVIALGLVTYCKDKWNVFDITIVILSLVELGLSNVKGLSILRSFRLLRVFKLAKSWPTLNLLIGIIGRTLGALGNLCFVLAIIVFIFAVMGMQLFGEGYTLEKFPEGVPRWNFLNFMHSFMIVFRVLCGEWIDSMWNCLHCNGYSCVPFFLLTMVIGNLVVLNLFLALLLSSFGAESLQQSDTDTEPNKLQEAMDRINRFVLFVKSHVLYCIKFKIKKKGTLDDCDMNTRTQLHSKEYLDGNVPMRNGKVRETERSPDGEGHETSRDIRRLFKGTSKSHVGYSPVSPYEPHEDEHECGEASTRPASYGSCSTIKISRVSSKDSKLHCSDSDSKSGSELSVISDSRYSDDLDSISKPIGSEGPEINEVNVIFVRYPDDCCPKYCVQKLACITAFEKTAFGQRWWTFRCYMYKLVEHKYFETFIIVCILMSSLALAIEDVYLPDRPTLQTVLRYMDKCFTIIFIAEMLIKWSAYGFKKYFTDAWCWLDFVIVAISLVMLAAEGAGLGNMGAFRALRTLRALRPLRAVSRWEGMKVVVNALIQAVPSIFNVLTVCLVFWLIFSIMGVHLFGGKFKYCADANGERVNISLVNNRTECEALTETHNFTWENPRINFDNVFTAYLALLQVATFKGWTDIMNYAIDIRDKDLQPKYEEKVYFYLYFVFFIVFGSFFTLNLFIGVIIENFNMQKKKAGGSLEMFMTDDQKKYYNAMKKLGSKQPQKPIPKPKFKCQLFFFKLTTNQMFDIGIMCVILLNMLTMAMEHYNQTTMYTDALMYVNQVFIAIFTLECVMKLLGLRWYYFKQPWNVFDFVVVVLSLLGIAMSEFIESYFVSPTLLRVVRVFRVGRVLRLVKSAKGIRTLLFSLAVSLPALFNIGLLLFLVMFIYAIFGMNFFLHVKHTAGIDDMFNFETFGRSMIVLFQISTSAGWDTTLAGLMNDREGDCTPADSSAGVIGDCGDSGLAILYLVTYLVISFLVVINMYIAVILENFCQATEDVQQGLTQDDFDMYYEIWERFDEKATQYIGLDKLREFVATLEEPLCIPEPNKYKLIAMNITICEGEKIHCMDILDALTKNFLGTSDDADFGDTLKTGPDRKDYFPVSSLVRRQHEILCAKRIQRRWRNYKRIRQPEEGGNKPPLPQQTTITIEAPPEDAEDNKPDYCTNKVMFEDIREDSQEEEERHKQSPSEQPVFGKDLSADDPSPHPAAMEHGDQAMEPDDSKTVELFPESDVVA